MNFVNLTILFRKYFITFYFFMLISLFFCSITLALASAPDETTKPASGISTGSIKTPSFIDALDKSSKTDGLEDDENMLMRGPPDDFNRGTPRGSIFELRKALKQGDYKTATNFLDYRNLPYSIEEEGGKERIAKKLLIIAKQTFKLDLTTVSTEVTGHKNDGLPIYRDRLARIKTRQGGVDILLQHVPRADGIYVWKISNATVAIIPGLYKQYGYGKIGEKLSEMFPGNSYLGLEVWQWVAYAGISTLSIIFTWILTVLINIPILRKNLLHTAKFVRGPLRFLIIILLVRFFFDYISPSVTARALFEAGTLLIASITWVTLGIVDIFVGRLIDRLRQAGQLESSVLLRPATAVVKIIIITLAILTWLDNLGFEVSTILAGLGVGSLAVALAAQKSIENMIGAVTIYASRTIRIGDVCRYKNIVGTVEEIGLRCTVIRTQERSIVHIPNGAMANEKIENLSLRDRILYRNDIHLRYESTPDQVRSVLENIRLMLAEHPMVNKEGMRVRFIDFGDSSLDIEIFAYIATADFNEHFITREDLNLRIMDIVSNAGTRLALPTNITYVEKNAAYVENNA